MNKIIQIEGQDLRSLINELTARARIPTYSLRVCIEGDNVKFKVNQGMWSPPLGKLDPECHEARLNRLINE